MERFAVGRDPLSVGREGIDDHRALAHDDEQDSRVGELVAFRDKCETIGWGDAEVVHALG